MPVKSPTVLPEISSRQSWANPEAQRLFGLALVKTGQRHKDQGLIQLGWSHQRAARGALREGPKAD